MVGLSVGSAIGAIVSAFAGKSNKLNDMKKFVVQLSAPVAGLFSGALMGCLTCKPLQKIDQQFIDENK